MYLRGPVHRESRRRPPVAVLGVAHHDPEPAVLDRVERVLVGQVVADVDRQHVGRCADVAEGPHQCPALVPVDIRTDLDDLAAARGPQARFLRHGRTHRRDHLVDPLGVHIAVVDRDGETFTFHQDPGTVPRRSHSVDVIRTRSGSASDASSFS